MEVSISRASPTRRHAWTRAQSQEPCTRRRHGRGSCVRDMSPGSRVTELSRPRGWSCGSGVRPLRASAVEGGPARRPAPPDSEYRAFGEHSARPRSRTRARSRSRSPSRSRSRSRDRDRDRDRKERLLRKERDPRETVPLPRVALVGLEAKRGRRVGTTRLRESAAARDGVHRASFRRTIRRSPGVGSRVRNRNPEKKTRGTLSGPARRMSRSACVAYAGRPSPGGAGASAAPLVCLPETELVRGGRDAVARAAVPASREVTASSRVLEPDG